jgi:dTDP-4-amino-4,6-dideoxygalactose transaminase
MNSRLDTIQAAILLEKLAVFPTELEARNRAAEKYTSELKSKYKVPVVPDGYVSSWAQYTLQADDRDAEMANYKALGVPTMVYYGTCLHEQAAFKALGYKSGSFPIAEWLACSVFSLPMHGYMHVNG